MTSQTNGVRIRDLGSWFRGQAAVLDAALARGAVRNAAESLAASAAAQAEEARTLRDIQTIGRANMRPAQPGTAI